MSISIQLHVVIGVLVIYLKVMHFLTMIIYMSSETMGNQNGLQIFFICVRTFIAYLSKTLFRETIE